MDAQATSSVPHAGHLPHKSQGSTLGAKLCLAADMPCEALLLERCGGGVCWRTLLWGLPWLTESCVLPGACDWPSTLDVCVLSALLGLRAQTKR